MATMKMFTAPATDSVKREFGMTKQSGDVKVTIRKHATNTYHLFADGEYLGFILGKEIVCGGQHFAFVPVYNEDHELRLKSLSSLVWDLSEGECILTLVHSLM